MVQIRPSDTDLGFGDVRGEMPRFANHLRAERKSPKTIESYTETVTQLSTYLEAQGMPLNASAITREHIDAYLADLLARGRSAATQALRYRALYNLGLVNLLAAEADTKRQEEFLDDAVERLRQAYPRLADFAALARDLDPTGRFRNAFLARVLA